MMNGQVSLFPKTEKKPKVHRSAPFNRQSHGKGTTKLW